MVHRNVHGVIQWDRFLHLVKNLIGSLELQFITLIYTF